MPIFSDRVAPRFDCARLLLLIDVKEGKIVDRTEVSFERNEPFERIQMLCDLKADVLICGAIDRFCASQLSFHGLAIYSWIAETVDDALSLLLEDRLESGGILNSGEGRRGRCGCKEKNAPRECEVIKMPGGDGTGPMGQGGGGRRGRGRGQGRGRGLGATTRPQGAEQGPKGQALKVDAEGVKSISKKEKSDE